MAHSVWTGDEAEAQMLDREDPLARFRAYFHLPRTAEDQEAVYLCGNSLGLQPRKTAQYVTEALEDWARLGAEGHFRARHPWLPYHENLTDQTAQLVGAGPQEVVVMNTLTVNLHLMLVSFYRPSGRRNKILIGKQPFPSDRYAITSQVKFRGLDPAASIIEAMPRPGEELLRTEDLIQIIERERDNLALVMMDGVNYYTGQALDMPAIAEVARQNGIPVGFDLAHGAGNLHLELHDWNVDFAVWCSYKYLNGGPGCLAGCFVHERHANRPDLPRFAGWWGHDKASRFLMGPEFHPIVGAEGWQLSNPPILPLAALRASMEIFSEAGMANLRRKSERLTAYLEFLISTRNAAEVEILTPARAEARGCQLSLRVRRNAREAFKKITAAGTICDWREPDVIRIAPVPLYNSFMDVFRFAALLRQATTGEVAR